MTNLKNTVLLAFASSSVAFAQGAASPIKIVSSTQLVTSVTQNGKTTEKLIDGSKALPGQILEMRQSIQNTARTNYGKGQLIQAIASSVTYQSNQCNVPGVTANFSTDPVQIDPKTLSLVNSKGINFSEKPTKTVTVKENGVQVKKTVAATSEDYTALRWNLPSLKGGQTISCQMRVKVK